MHILCIYLYKKLKHYSRFLENCAIQWVFNVSTLIYLKTNNHKLWECKNYYNFHHKQWNFILKTENTLKLHNFQIVKKSVHCKLSHLPRLQHLRSEEQIQMRNFVANLAQNSKNLPPWHHFVWKSRKIDPRPYCWIESIIYWFETVIFRNFERVQRVWWFRRPKWILQSIFNTLMRII